MAVDRAAALRDSERSAATTALACWYGGGGGGVLVGGRCMRCGAIYSEEDKISKEEVMLEVTFLVNLIS